MGSMDPPEFWGHQGDIPGSPRTYQQFLFNLHPLIASKDFLNTYMARANTEL